MGMYDNVKVEAKMPDGAPSATFQTKDFDDPFLETYTITAGGRLNHETRGDVQFHGVLNFYHYDTAASKWWEYNAKFTDGNLVGISKAEER